LRILECRLNILDVETVEEPLKRASNEFAALVVYARNRLGIVRQPTLDEFVLYMMLCVLFSILINSTRFNAVSIQVSALNSIFLLLTLTVHGPIKSIATTSQGSVHISLSGNSL